MTAHLAHPDRTTTHARWFTIASIGWFAAVVTLVMMEFIAAARSPAGPRSFGHDFLPGYAAGQIVRTGRWPVLYDPTVVTQVESEIITKADLAGDARFGPWVNPPFFAAAFATLSAWPYRDAANIFLVLNLLLVAGSIWILGRLLPTGRSRVHRLLLPMLLVGSAAFWQVMTHQQSTYLSLALLAGATLAWKSGRLMLAGVLAGLLAYKPQLAMGAVLALSIVGGWRTVVGVAAAGGTIVALNEWFMPGTMLAWVRAVPAIVRQLQLSTNYNWSRQVTLQGFWRLLLPHHEATATSLWLGSVALVAGLLMYVARRTWAGRVERARFIAASFVAMPLWMPYFMDYDLLLLAVPAVLLSGSARSSRMLAAWIATYVATVLTPIIGPSSGVNITVLGLVWLVMDQARAIRSNGDLDSTDCGDSTDPTPLAQDSTGPGEIRRAA